MTALEEANLLYAKFPHMNLQEDLEFCAKYGWVICSKDVLLLLYEYQGGWVVYLAVGKNRLQQIFKLLPYELPKIGWMRLQRGEKEIRWYETEKLRNALNV